MVAARAHGDNESNAVTEDSSATLHSIVTSSESSRSSTAASTSSFIFERIHGNDMHKKDVDPFIDAETPFNNDFEELEVEEGPFYHNKSIDAKYKRWLYIVGAACSIGWLLALVLFLSKGSYRHRSTLAHDPGATSSIGTGKKISIDQLQAGTWSARSHGISWIAGPNGEDGLLLEKNTDGIGNYLVVEDIRNREQAEALNRIILMRKSGFETEAGYVIPWEVWPSPDLKTVLVMSDRQHNWRHSFTGKYWLFDVEKQHGEPLDPWRPHDRIQLATWSPTSADIVFTRNNNMFVRRLSVVDGEPLIVQITHDGGAEMFNGVPDWVYEEEVFSGNSATWWSQDGNFIAFLATNETEVPEYPIQYFVSRPSGVQPANGLENYPEVRKIKYPKAGAPNPVVHLRFYDVQENQIFNIPIQNDFNDDDRLITEVVWAGSTGQILIRETNRESDILKMVLIDVKRRIGGIVRTTNVAELDGGWFEISETTTFVPNDPVNGRPDDGYVDTIIHEGYDHLAYFSPLDNPEPKLLTTGKWEVVSAPSAVDLKNNVIYFIGTKESPIQRHLYKVQLDGSGLTPVTDTSKEGYYAASLSKGAGYALVSYQGPGIPWQKVISTPSNPEKYESEVENNTVLANLAAEYELPIKIFQTVTIDGYELNVVERRPPHFNKDRKYPVLFFLYGGPGSQQVDKRFTVDFQSYVAASLGYIVVTVDGRGTGFIGRKARCIVRGNIGYYEAYDQIQTAKMWAKKSYVDDRRMAIWGWSYGGFLTLKTLEQDAGHTFQFGMSVAPVTNWRFYDTIYTERWMHTPQHNPSGYDNSSISNVTALAANTRFLLMHGVADDNVHLQNSLTLLDKLDLAGIENYDVHVFPDSDHGIYFHNANKIVYDKLAWWLTNAFNGEWAKIEHPVPSRPGKEYGIGE